MVPARCLVVILSSMWCMTSCYGRMITDDEEENDDLWPVLCPPYTFYSREQELCLPCSRCPINKIITSPCHGLYDTKCGPFYDFQNIPHEDTKNVDNFLSENQDGGRNNFLNNIKINSTIFKLQSNMDSEGSKYHRHDSRQDSSDDVEMSDSEWRSLTIALIVLVFVFFIVVIMSVTYLLRRKFVNDKKLVCEYTTPPENV